jgi:hypothetical protein
MFPIAGDEIFYNEDGEPVGWSRPSEPDDYYCDECGFNHVGSCRSYWPDDEE